MEQTQTTTDESTTPSPDLELVRPVEGRMVAGLSAGLANRFGVPTLLVRALFVILALGGGLGVALYAAGWFLTRSVDEGESPAQRMFSGSGNVKSWLGLGLMLVAFVIFLQSFSFVSGGFLWAFALVVIGLLLYTVDFPEVAKRRPSSVDDPADPGSETFEGPDELGGVTTLEGPSQGPDRPGLPILPPPTPPLMPAPKTPRPPKERSMLGQLTIGVIAFGVGLIALLDNTTDLVSPDAMHYVALAITILGVGLLVGTLFGRARWLILIGVLSLPVLAVSIAWGWGWTNDSVERRIVPISFDELATSYDYNIGEVEVDLTDLPWSGQDVDLEVILDAGNIEVVVPRGVAITGMASAEIGRVAGPGGQSYGIGDIETVFEEPGTRGEVSLDLQLDVGNIDVVYR